MDFKILNNKVAIPIMSLIKQIKLTKHMAPLCFQTYNKESKLYIVSHLTEYLKRTKSFGNTDKLFLTCSKPYRAASKDTTSRWCKSIMKESSISIYNYTSHSSRDVASSYPKSLEHPCQKSYKVQFGNQRELSPCFTRNRSKKKLNFKIINCKTIIFYKRFVKVYSFKKFL